MKRKSSISLLVLLLSCPLLSCENQASSSSTQNKTSDKSINTDSHTHNYSNTWSNDENYHWHTCSGCDAKKDYEQHDLEYVQIDTGHYKQCSICGYKTAEENHTYDSDGVCSICEFMENSLNQLTFSISNDEVSITDCNESAIKVTIPNSYQGYPVTSIGNDAFYNCTSLTSIILPNSITSIGSYAFGYCTSLTSVTIPKNVTSIGKYGFFFCTSLISINIPNSVTSIEQHTFFCCTSLIAITIPNSITSIGSSAFCLCSSLTYILIPDSVAFIDSNAFGYCSSLSSIIIDENNLNYFSDNQGVVYNKSMSSLICCPGGKESITILSSVTSIDNYAFYGCSILTSVAIPNNVTSIGKYAFSFCSSLVAVIIPRSVTTIDEYAFNNCSSLTYIYYEGTPKEWTNISISQNNSNLTSAKNYYYNKTKPTDTTYNYWHYIGDVPTSW